MEGAKKKIEDFYGYKAKDKNVIIGDQLNLEALYNTIAMRLSHNKRPGNSSDWLIEYQSFCRPLDSPSKT